MTLDPLLIYKILTPAQWAQCRANGRFDGSPDDLRDGYIHLSTAAQIDGTLDRHYADADELVLVGLDAADLGSALIFELARGGMLFPHLYGPLGLTACRTLTSIRRHAPGWRAAEGAMAMITSPAHASSSQ